MKMIIFKAKFSFISSKSRRFSLAWTVKGLHLLKEKWKAFCFLYSHLHELLRHECRLLLLKHICLCLNASERIVRLPSWLFPSLINHATIQFKGYSKIHSLAYFYRFKVQNYILFQGCLNFSAYLWFLYWYTKNYGHGDKSCSHKTKRTHLVSFHSFILLWSGPHTLAMNITPNPEVIIEFCFYKQMKFLHEWQVFCDEYTSSIDPNLKTISQKEWLN